LLAQNMRLRPEERNWAEIDAQMQQLPGSPLVRVLQAEVDLRKDPSRVPVIERSLREARDDAPDLPDSWLLLANLAAGPDGSLPERALAVLKEAEQRPTLADRAAILGAQLRYLVRLKAADAKAGLRAVERELPKLSAGSRARLRLRLAEAWIL